MSEFRVDQKGDVLQLWTNAYTSLDIVRSTKDERYAFVFSSRWPVETRIIIRIPFRATRDIIEFLAQTYNFPTKPAPPTTPAPHNEFGMDEGTRALRAKKTGL